MTPAHPAPTQDFPIASYRLQMRGDMDFAAVEALIPYLRELGISHLYLSPIFTAALPRRILEGGQSDRSVRCASRV